MWWHDGLSLPFGFPFRSANQVALLCGSHTVHCWPATVSHAFCASSDEPNKLLCHGCELYGWCASVPAGTQCERNLLCNAGLLQHHPCTAVPRCLQPSADTCAFYASEQFTGAFSEPAPIPFSLKFRNTGAFS